MVTLLVVASRTDNTKTFIPVIKEYAVGEIVECINTFDVSPEAFDKIIIGSYTWSNGKIPKKLKEYLIKYHKVLKNKDVFIFGSGYSIYPHFCGAVDGISIICNDSGANVHYKFKFELRYNESDFEAYEIQEMKNKLSSFFIKNSLLI